MKKANPKGVAFFDIRPRAEAMYVGWPSDADALVPYVEHPELMTGWDDKRHMYKLAPNQDFVPEIERRLKDMSLGKDATIILVCRSGDCSSKVQDRLQTAGYTKVYGIAEGGGVTRPRTVRKPVSAWSTAGRAGPTSWTRRRCISRADRQSASGEILAVAGIFFVWSQGDFIFCRFLRFT